MGLLITIVILWGVWEVFAGLGLFAFGLLSLLFGPRVELPRLED